MCYCTLQELAETTAVDRQKKPATSPRKQKVEKALAAVLREGGAQVLENVVVGGSLNVGVLMGNQAAKRGVAVELLDDVSGKCSTMT